MSVYQVLLVIQKERSTKIMANMEITLSRGDESCGKR
jgi:hypothetical protein